MHGWADVCKRVLHGAPQLGEGCWQGQTWSSLSNSSIFLLFVQIPRRISFLSSNYLIDSSAHVNFYHLQFPETKLCEEVLLFSVLNRASAGFVLLWMSRQDWARLVETQHMKVKNPSVTCISGECITPGDALPPSLSFQPRSCLCRLHPPSKSRFARNLLAGDNLANVHLLCLQPLSWSANGTIFAAFHVRVGFVGCYPKARGSEWVWETSSLPNMPQHNESTYCKQIKSSTLLQSHKSTQGSPVLVFVFVTHRCPLFSFNPMEMEYKAKHRLSTVRSILL